MFYLVYKPNYFEYQNLSIMKSKLHDKPFINISYELNNIRIYKIQNNFWAYIVNESDILPIESKYAIKICSEVLKLTDGIHLSNLVFAFPSTYKTSDKKKIRDLCKSQTLDKRTLMSMLLLLK